MKQRKVEENGMNGRPQEIGVRDMGHVQPISVNRQPRGFSTGFFDHDFPRWLAPRLSDSASSAR
ncbi:MAG: hypothetical protein IID46_05775 [Planctomycetes bacterium]|nr:hypothetical protein [Planctomycetota bacterium]